MSINNNKKIKYDYKNENYDSIGHISAEKQVKNLVDAIKQSKFQIQKIENEKRKNTELLIPLVKQMNSVQIEKACDMQFCKDIAAQFDKCITQAELNLLDTIEVIAKCAAEHESQKYRQNFANIFEKSGLLDCILNGINECVPDVSSSEDKYGYSIFQDNYDSSDNSDDNDWIWEDKVQQLTRIFCYIYCLSDFDCNLPDRFGDILTESIVDCIQNIENLCEEIINQERKYLVDSDSDVDFDENNEDEVLLMNKINELEIFLTTLKYGTQGNRQITHCFVRSKFIQDLEPLFHIDCPEELNCQHCIVFPESIDGQSLHLLAMEVLSLFVESENKFSLYLTNMNFSRVIEHLAPSIISYLYSTSFQSKYSIAMDQSSLSLTSINISPSQHKFNIYLNFLHNIIVNSRIASMVVSFPNLLPILIALTFTTKNLDHNTYISKSMINAREQCIEIGSLICQHCDQQIQHKVLVEMKFARSLAVAACLGGGIEVKNSIIKQAKKSFYSIIFPLIETLNKQQQQIFSIHSDLEEEIEYEGGFEEFDSLDSDKRKRNQFSHYNNFNHFINNPFL